MAAFLLGLAGSSFAIGVGYVSRWTPPERQGSALGSLRTRQHRPIRGRVPGARCLAARFGMTAVFRGVAVLLVVWAAVFALLARNAPAPAGAQRKGLGAYVQVLARERLSWLLSAFYFLTFGGFVAFSIYLPTLLKDQFHLAPADAGFAPPDSWCSPRCCARWADGSRTASAARACCPRSSWAWLPSPCFWHGRPSFPSLWARWAARRCSGSATARCSNWCRNISRTRPAPSPAWSAPWAGWADSSRRCCWRFSAAAPAPSGRASLLLASAALVLWWANHKVFVPRQQALDIALPADLRRTADRLRAGAWATLWTALLVAAIVVGSRNLQNFDPALVIYTFAVVFATWGVVYHYNVWLEKPPTRVVLGSRLGTVPPARRAPQRSPACRTLAVTHLAAQRFIAHRSRLRWWMHQCLFWGCLLAVAITFPLVFGWIHFRTLPDDQLTYVTYLFGFPTGSFRLHTLAALAAVSRPGHLGGAGAGGHRAFAVAPHDRSGRARAAAIRHGFSAHHPAVRHFGDRAWR